jgi:hypothetical protein
MNLIDIYFVFLYLHFNKLKDSGRKFVQWYSTCVAVSLFTSSFSGLILKLVVGSNYNDKISEPVFLIGFMGVGISCFFLTKYYFFRKEKHIHLSEKYMNTYSQRQRSIYKIPALFTPVAIIFGLGFILWLMAKPIR